MPVSAPPEPGWRPLVLDPVREEPEGGVIEEARRRQWRRRLAGGAVAALGTAAALAALLSGGGGRHAGAGRGGSPAKPLALVDGRARADGQTDLIGVTPSLQAGNVGVCVRVANQGGCNGSPPTSTDPVYGEGGFSPENRVGRDGEVDALFTGPGVAAVRVAHLGTFRVRHAPGLPPGAGEVVFYRPPGSRGTVLGPGMSPQILQGFDAARKAPALTETLLSPSGRTIPVKASRIFMLPNSYWQGTRHQPAAGRCAISTSFPGAQVQWGQVADRITGDPAVTVAAWLTCLHVWYSADGTSFETALLLNARSPGSPPAPLWNAIPLRGHPGIVQIPAVERQFRVRAGGRARTLTAVLVPPTVARRAGAAWLLVRYGASLAQRIRFLNDLRVQPPRLG